MYKIKFLRTRRGERPFLEYLMGLKKQSKTNKHAKTKLNKMLFYLNRLKEVGTSIGAPIIKTLINTDIYKMRVLSSRVFFLKDGEYFVIMSEFVKTTQKTPNHQKALARKLFNEYYEVKNESKTKKHK